MARIREKKVDSTRIRATATVRNVLATDHGPRTMGSGQWLCIELPITEYRLAWDLQGKLTNARKDRILDTDIILLLEHQPVFTLGRRGNRKHLLVAESFLGSQGIEVVHIERGGDITYHGPGQVVGYPIVDLRARQWRVVDFVEALEEVMIRTAADWGVVAKRNAMNRGVWIGKKKLGSIGIAIRRGISFHGFAFNVNTSLEPFTWIHPCGLQGLQAASLKQIVGQEIAMADVYRSSRLHIQEIFGVQLKSVNLEAVYRLLEAESLGPEEKASSSRNIFGYLKYG